MRLDCAVCEQPLEENQRIQEVASGRLRHADPNDCIQALRVAVDAALGEYDNANESMRQRGRWAEVAVTMAGLLRGEERDDE